MNSIKIKIERYFHCNKVVERAKIYNNNDWLDSDIAMREFISGKGIAQTQGYF